MSKRIISIVLVVFMALSLFAFVGCSNREETQQRISDLQQQMAELQSLLQQQTALLTELQSANTEMTNAQTATIAQITELQGQLQSQAEKVTKIEDALNSNLIFNASKALQEVIEYAESKDKSNYPAGNWVFVENLIEMAETQIYKQKTIEDIYKLVPKIKASIDRVPQDLVVGEKIPWDGKFREEGDIIISISTCFISNTEVFTIDDFWMLDNIEIFELARSDTSWDHSFYDHLLIKLNPHNLETVAEAIGILEKLCYCKEVEVGFFAFWC